MFGILLLCGLAEMSWGASTVQTPLLPVTDPATYRDLQNLTQNVTTTVSNLVPSGSIFEYAGSTAPTSYYSCDGSTKSQTVDANLYNAIGTIWNTGGEGTGNFRLPNFQRRTLVGFGGSGTSVLGSTVGALGGEEAHTQTIAEMPSHNHTITDPGHSHLESAYENLAGGAQQFVQAGAGGSPTLEANIQPPTQTVTTGITINNTGSGTAFNVIQPSAIVMFIIKR